MQTATATRTAKNKGAATTTRPASKKVTATNFYVAALKEAGGFHKSSFHIEMAVCLAFYTEQEKADLNAKKLLRPIYEKAGYDCKTPQGDDYKTIQRRISVAADLFAHVGGHETVYDWMDREQGARGIATLVKELEKRKLDNISLVLAAAGKPEKRQYTKRKESAPAQAGGPSDADKAYMKELNKDSAVNSGGTGVVVQTGSLTRRATDRLPDERILRTDHITVAIPLDATQDEVKALALKLLEFATTALAAAPAQPAGAAVQT